MTSLEHIATKIHELDSREKVVELTPKRLRRLRNELNTIKGIVETNARIGTANPVLTKADFETIGEMDYLITHFFPYGNVPEVLKPYADFVSRMKGIDFYHEVFDAKLQRDADNIRKKDNVSEADDPAYARTLVNIVECDELVPEKSKLLITFGNQTLYEENIPDYVFLGLPEKSTVVLEYTNQGLTLDLKKTLDESSKTTVNLSEIEKIVITAFSEDLRTKGYIDSLYDQINEELDK